MKNRPIGYRVKRPDASLETQLAATLAGLHVTDAGTALHAEASAEVEATRRELTAGIGADEYAIAVSVLERMSNNADRIAAR